MAHFRNDKSLFIAARTGAQPFMRFTCECELIVCTKGCEPGLAFKKRVKAIRECLLKRVCFWVPHFILPVLGESSGSKHSDLTDFKRFTFPFFLSFSVIFFILQTMENQESFLVPVLLARRNRSYFTRFQSTLCPIQLVQESHLQEINPKTSQGGV